MVEKLKFWHGLMAGFLIGVIMTGLLSIIYVKQTATKYGYVNVKAIMGLVLKDLGSRDFSQEDYRRIAEEQREHFVFLLEEYCKKNHYVIFSSPKPIGGAVDLTKLFLDEVQISLDRAALAMIPSNDEEMLVHQTAELNKKGLTGIQLYKKHGMQTTNAK